MPRVDVFVRVNPLARAEVRKAASVLIRRVLKAIVAEMRRVVSRPFPPASRPGEAPHLRTGTLRDSIHHVYDEAKLTGHVLVDAPYAGYLEKGTRKMKKRPFALVTARRVLGWFNQGYFTSTRSITED